MRGKGNLRHHRGSRGIALLMALLLLLLLSALAVALSFSTDSDLLINANFRKEQVASFAAKAGMEEARDRMSHASANSIFNTVMGTSSNPLPVPAAGNRGIIYLLNEGNQPGSVQPWDSSNAYFDAELCHDGYNIGGWPSSVSSPGISCTDVPSGNGWYQTITSTAPFAGTAAAIPFKWVRIARKLNASVSTSGTIYYVDPTQPADTEVCWNGTSEILKTSAAATCMDMTPQSADPVFLLTALGVSNSATPSGGARQMVQAEVALTPGSPFPFGLFATSNSCSAITLNGGSITDGYHSVDSSGNTTPYGGLNVDPLGGSVGSFGGVTLTGSNTTVGGYIGYPSSGDPCASPLSTSGGAHALASPATQTFDPTSINIPMPAPPNPLPPTTNKNINKNTSLTPGNFGNINITGGSTVTMTPGIYNINSLSMTGNSILRIVPAGQVVFNVAGTGVSSGQSVVNLSGGTISNTTGSPVNLVINYAGTSKISVSGGANTSVVVDAPNSDVAITGGTDVFGSIIGHTITDTGGTKYHYDESAARVLQPNGYFTLISAREIDY